MNLGQLKTRCATRFRDPNNNIYAPGDWTAYLNDAQQDITALSTLWPWLEGSVASATAATGVRTLTLGGGLVAYNVTALLNTTDEWKMQAIEGRSALYRMYPDVTEQGRPRHYRVFNSTIEVYPLPDADTTFRVEYHLDLPDLVADGDTPSIPARFHQCLVEGAMARAYIDDGNDSQSAAHQAACDRIVKSMQWELLGSRQDRPSQPVDDWYL